MPSEVRGWRRWLAADALIAYGWIGAIAFGVAADALFVMSQGILDVQGPPVVCDFLGVWSAGLLALNGHAAAAYDFASHRAVEESLIHGNVPIPYLGWHYPPQFLLVAAFLAQLPFRWSRLVWLGSTLAAYLGVMRTIVRHRATPLVAVAFGAVAINVALGQNGFFSVALLGSGLLLLERRPLVAGALLGCCAYKPQLAVLLPFALLAGRHWKAAVAAGVTLIALMALATVILGPDIWAAFRASLPITQATLEQGASVSIRMASVFAMMRSLGGGLATAWVAQALASMGAIALICWAWRRQGPLELKAALLAAIAPLATPYVLGYDLMLLALPIAVLIKAGMSTALSPLEHAVLISAFVAPLALNLQSGDIPFAPIVCGALAIVVFGRLRGWDQALDRRETVAQATGA